jgi:hypothetical protein
MAQRVEHRVPAGALAGPDAAQVPLQLTRRDQLREHELRQRGVTEVGHPLGAHLRARGRLLAVLRLVTKGPAAVSALRPPHLLAVAYLAVVVTAVAFVLWYSAGGRLGSARAGLLTGVAPIAAATAGVLLGSPVPGPGVWAGTALVAVGLVVGVGATPGPRVNTRAGDHEDRPEGAWGPPSKATGGNGVR